MTEYSGGYAAGKIKGDLKPPPASVVSKPAPSTEDSEALAEQMRDAIYPINVPLPDPDEESRIVSAATDAALAWFASRQPASATEEQAQRAIVTRGQIATLRERITSPEWQRASAAARVEGILHALNLWVIR